MPFFRPSLKDIRKRRISDFEFELGSQSARVPGTVEHALAVSGSGTSHGLHGRLDVVSRNAFPHLAEDEALIRWAQFYGISRLEAEPAEGILLVAPSLGVDVLCPIGTIWVGPTGVEHEVTESTTILAVNLVTEVPIRARESGVAGNIASGTELSIQSPITGISPTAAVGADGLTGGTDAETTTSLRSRLLQRIRQPPKGGGPGDYVRWAKQVPGVTRAWEFGGAPKIGYVTVCFVRDLDVPSIFPNSAERAKVRGELKKYAPICAPEPIVWTPDQTNLVLEIELTIEPGADLATVRAAIIRNIQDMLLERAAPQAALWHLPKSWISEAISQTPGEYDHKLTLPVGDIPVAELALPTLSPLDVTWV